MSLKIKLRIMPDNHRIIITEREWTKINILKQRFLKGIQDFKSMFTHDMMLKKEQMECLVIFPLNM